MRPRQPIEVRFAQQWQAREDGCWEWTGVIGNHGHGTIRQGGAASKRRRYWYCVSRLIPNSRAFSLLRIWWVRGD
jgi:hypothetical protein